MTNNDLLQLKVNQAIISCPTGDNVQPFKLEWNNLTLQIYVDTKLTKHVLNYAEMCTKISMGSVVELARIAAKKLQFRTAYKILPDFGNSNGKPWMEITFISDPTSTANTDDQILFDSIPIRHVNRLLYEGGELPTDFIEWLNTNCQDFSEIKVSPISFDKLAPEPYANLLTRIAGSELILYKNKTIFKDIAYWFRTNRIEAYKTRDGMYLNQLPIKKMEYPIFKIFKKWPGLLEFMVKLGMGKKIYKDCLKTIQSSAGVIILWAPKNFTDEIASQVGSMAIRIWLKLNSMNYGVQPLSVITLGNSGATIYPETKEIYFDDKFSTENDNQISYLRKICNIQGDSLLPYWAFRTGKAQPLPFDNRSLRRDKSTFIYNKTSSKPEQNLAKKNVA
jgi:hypothetical protein